jgi:uncharacterized protein (DUF2342 family)
MTTAQRRVEIVRILARGLARHSRQRPRLGPAEQLGRKCVGIELEPRYVDVIVNRWENLTRRKAVHQYRDEPPAGERR